MNLRMGPLGAVGFAVSAYVAVYGIALWHHLAGDLADGILCAAPAALAVALAGTSQTDRRQYVARLFAALMFLPALLLMWASSHDHAARELDHDQVEQPVTGEKLVTLLAAVIARSGYGWRPRILPGGQSKT